MPTYRNRATGQTVTLDARSARLDRLTDRWELTDDPGGSTIADEAAAARDAAAQAADHAAEAARQAQDETPEPEPEAPEPKPAPRKSKRRSTSDKESS